jgi:hypothetical protein
VAHKTIFLDMDRTLLNTHEFVQAIWRAAEKHYRINSGHAIAEMPKYYRNVGELRYHDMYLQLSEMFGLDPDEVVATIRPDLQQQDFMYADAKSVLALQKNDLELRIITFGEPWFQQVKLSFLPALSHLPRDILVEGKGEFLARVYPQAAGWIIDDKHNPHLPPAIQEVYLDRASDTSFTKKDGIIIINSLKHFQEAL